MVHPLVRKRRINDFTCRQGDYWLLSECFGGVYLPVSEIITCIFMTACAYFGWYNFRDALLRLGLATLIGAQSTMPVTFKGKNLLWFLWLLSLFSQWISSVTEAIFFSIGLTRRRHVCEYKQAVIDGNEMVHWQNTNPF